MAGVGLRRGVLAVAVLLGTAPARAEDAAMRRPAGYVVAVDTPAPEAPAPGEAAEDPEAGAYLLRDGQQLPLEIGGALFDGDEVVVRVPRTTVEIETVGDHHVRIDAARSPHRVQGELPAGGRFGAFAALVAELFQARPQARTVNLIGRTETALRLPLGRGIPQRVLPGAPLWVGWQGGVAPFTVEIRAVGAAPAVLATVAVPEHASLLRVPEQAAGPLQLAVRDAQGSEAAMALLASPLPPPLPAWIREGAPTADFGQVAAALWLLDQTPAEWDLQAGALAAQAGDYGAARELLQRLAEGRRPKP